MAKRVKSFVKKCIKGYVNGLASAYKPCLEAGVNPFI